MVTNFQDRVQDLTGPLITADNNAMEQWCVDAIYEVINQLNIRDRAFDIHKFVTASADIVNATPTDIDSLREIRGVERNGIPCRKVPWIRRNFVNNSSSIFEATSDDPIYYTFNHKLHIVPDPSGTEVGTIYSIPEYTVQQFFTGEGASSIANFPKEYYEHVVLYTAVIVVSRQMQDLIMDVSGTNLSVDIIIKMFRGDVPDDGGNVFDFLIDEDTEMVSATLSAIQGASTIIKQKYDWYAKKLK